MLLNLFVIGLVFKQLKLSVNQYLGDVKSAVYTGGMKECRIIQKIDIFYI